MEMEDKTENGDSIMAAVVRWTNKNIYTCLGTENSTKNPLEH